MSRHVGEVNEWQVNIERIEATVTTTGAPVKIVTADASYGKSFSKGEASTPSFQ